MSKIPKRTEHRRSSEIVFGDLVAIAGTFERQVRFTAEEGWEIVPTIACVYLRNESKNVPWFAACGYRYSYALDGPLE